MKLLYSITFLSAVICLIFSLISIGIWESTFFFILSFCYLSVMFMTDGTFDYFYFLPGIFRIAATNFLLLFITMCVNTKTEGEETYLTSPKVFSHLLASYWISFYFCAWISPNGMLNFKVLAHPLGLLCSSKNFMRSLLIDNVENTWIFPEVVVQNYYFALLPVFWSLLLAIVLGVIIFVLKIREIKDPEFFFKSLSSKYYWWCPLLSLKYYFLFLLFFLKRFLSIAVFSFLSHIKKYIFILFSSLIKILSSFFSQGRNYLFSFFKDTFVFSEDSWFFFLRTFLLFLFSKAKRNLPVFFFFFKRAFSSFFLFVENLSFSVKNYFSSFFK